jgi:hypothetical protein
VGAAITDPTKRDSVAAAEFLTACGDCAKTVIYKIELQ